jgi:hypothetical protein
MVVLYFDGLIHVVNNNNNIIIITLNNNKFINILNNNSTAKDPFQEKELPQLQVQAVNIIHPKGVRVLEHLSIINICRIHKAQAQQCHNNQLLKFLHHLLIDTMNSNNNIDLLLLLLKEGYKG